VEFYLAYCQLLRASCISTLVSGYQQEYVMYDEVQDFVKYCCR